MAVLSSTAPSTKNLDDQARILKALLDRHRQEDEQLKRLDAHYTGTQPLTYLAPELVVEMGDRMRQVVVNWPELVVDSVEERLDVEGFRLGGAPEADDRLWSWWQGNGLDVGSHQAHVDALTMRRSYVIVGSRGEGDTDRSSGVDESVPLITWESPLECIAVRDPRTRRVNNAVKWWDEAPLDGGSVVKHATLYRPDSTSWWVQRGGKWVPDPDYAPDVHGMGVVPVVPLVNRARTSSRTVQTEGWSDLESIIPLSDAACKAATDMMVGAEYHALPRRWAVGVSSADFTDEHGNPLPVMSRIAGRIWANEGSPQDVQFGQFAESDLSNFIDVIKLLAQLVASISGLPPHYLGMPTDNPASADAIRSSEARLVKRAERKQRAFGEAWEQVMRVALLVADGDVPERAARMETMWRDPSTPTVAQQADATVKLVQANVLPRQQAWTDLGYTAVEQERLQRWFDEEQARAASLFGTAPGAEQMPGQPAPSSPGMTEADLSEAGEPPATPGAAG